MATSTAVVGTGAARKKPDAGGAAAPAAPSDCDDGAHLPLVQRAARIVDEAKADAIPFTELRKLVTLRRTDPDDDHATVDAVIAPDFSTTISHQLHMPPDVLPNLLRFLQLDENDLFSALLVLAEHFREEGDVREDHALAALRALRPQLWGGGGGGAAAVAAAPLDPPTLTLVDHELQ